MRNLKPESPSWNRSEREEYLRLLTLRQEREEARLKQAAEDHLYDFVKQAWSVLEPGTPFCDNWHIQAVCDTLEALHRGIFRDLVINIPPRHLKSIIVSQCFPAWVWVHDSSRRFLTASYAQSLSTDNSVACRRIIESEWYQKNWGDRFKLTKDQNQKIEFENDHRGRLTATSVDGVGTGKGGDYILVDDPQNAKETGSDRETSRQSVIDWWTKTMPTRRNDPRTSRRVLVMQRLHEEDLSGYVIGREGWVHLCLPARFEVDRRCVIDVPYNDGGGHAEEQPKVWHFEDPRTNEGELLHEERIPEEELRKLEDDLRDDASGQLQQRPESKGGDIFDEAKWQRYAHADLPADSEWDVVVQSWDLAFEDKATNDFNVGAVWAKKGADFYVLGLYRKRAPFDVVLEDFEGLQSKWPWSLARAKLLENKANGPALRRMAGKKISGIIPITPEKSKTQRAWAVQPYQAAGNFHVPHDEGADSWWGFSADAKVRAFVHEHKVFPKGRHDDQVDTTTQAGIYLDSHGAPVTENHRIADDASARIGGDDDESPTTFNF